MGGSGLVAGTPCGEKSMKQFKRRCLEVQGGEPWPGTEQVSLDKPVWCWGLRREVWTARDGAWPK